MKNLIVILSVISIFASTIAHASSEVTVVNNVTQASVSQGSVYSNSITVKQYDKTDKKALYQNLSLGIPLTIHYITNMIAFVQTMMVQTEQARAKDAVNPADPNFASCMQTAINDKFYETSFNNTYNDYIASVSQNSLEQDMIVINHPVTVFNNKLYFNVFEQLAQNENIEQNYQLSEKLRNQTRVYDSESIPIDGLSSTYYQYFGNKSAFAQVIANQVEQCQEAQNSSIIW